MFYVGRSKFDNLWGFYHNPDKCLDPIEITDEEHDRLYEQVAINNVQLDVQNGEIVLVPRPITEVAILSDTNYLNEVELDNLQKELNVVNDQLLDALVENDTTLIEQLKTKKKEITDKINKLQTELNKV